MSRPDDVASILDLIDDELVAPREFARSSEYDRRKRQHHVERAHDHLVGQTGGSRRSSRETATMSSILSDKSFVGRTVFVTFLRLVAGSAAEISCEKGARPPFGILGCPLIVFEPVAERADA